MDTAVGLLCGQGQAVQPCACVEGVLLNVYSKAAERIHISHILFNLHVFTYLKTDDYADILILDPCRGICSALLLSMHSSL